jgi:hypothetical protein
VRTGGRLVFGVTAVVGALALLIQVVLTLRGAGAPNLTVGTRFVRFLSYFTIESNIAVTVSCAALALAPGTTSRWVHTVRVDAVVGIFVTGVIHLVLLRPLGSPSGIGRVTDEAFHVVVPILAVLGWLIWGPRPIRLAVFRPALIWPIAYVLWTGIHGAVTGWYPYPFVDVSVHGYPRVVATGLAILVAFAALAALVRLRDTRPRAPA